MNVLHRDLAGLAQHLQLVAPDPSTRSMLGELSDRYQKEPDKAVEGRELYSQALRMSDFGKDTKAKVTLGRAAMEYLSQRTACQVAAGFCIQAGAAVTGYDSEWALYRAALKQPEQFENCQIAPLALGMMSACERFQADHAKIGELACRQLSQQPEAGQALHQSTFNRTHNQDALLYKEALTAIAQGPSASVPAVPESYLNRLDRVSGAQASYARAVELLREASQNPEQAPVAKVALEMLEKCRDYKVCLMVARSVLEDFDAGKTAALSLFNRVNQTLSAYPPSPIDKSEVATMGLAQFKGQLEHEPIASMALAAASQSSTHLAQFEVCRVAIGALAEEPRPSPGVVAARMTDAAAEINLRSASRSGQAALQAIGALYETPEVKTLCQRLEGQLAESRSYNEDVELIRSALRGLEQLPAPASGSLLAMARAAAGVSDSTAIGEKDGQMVVGGVRLKLRKRDWEVETPKS